MSGFRSRSERIFSLLNNNNKKHVPVPKKRKIKNVSDDIDETYDKSCSSSVCSSPAPSCTPTMLALDEIISRREDFTQSETDDAGVLESTFKKPRPTKLQNVPLKSPCRQVPKEPKIFNEERLHIVRLIAALGNNHSSTTVENSSRSHGPVCRQELSIVPTAVADNNPYSTIEKNSTTWADPMLIEGLPHVIAFQNQGQNKIEPAPECRKILKFKKIGALVDYSPSGSSSCTSPEKAVKPISPEKKKKVKTRLRRPEYWKCNLRQNAKQHGEAYISVRNKFVPKKALKEPCSKSCKFKCRLNVPKEERYVTFNNYYSMTEEGKNHFILSHTKMNVAKRHETEKIRKKYSYEYYLPVDKEKKKVCSKMFLSTLAISCKKVYNVNEKKKHDDIPESSEQGKHRKKYITDERKDLIRRHIGSFPTVDSKRQYLDSRLSLKKMYELYVESCKVEEKQPCLLHTYAKIFNEEYNYAFHKPKKDCDKWNEHGLITEKNVTKSADNLKDLENHIKEKNYMREVREVDRKTVDKTLVKLSFDLEPRKSILEAQKNS